MLQRLFIKNYALIDRLDISLSAKLNMITGETGAGKSIILGALSLILGQRANLTALKSQKAKCIVEGTFDIEAYQLQPFFDAAELDYEIPTIIRREITPSGKSRAFINDTPVRLNVLKELGEKLINLHAQHQTLHLYDAQYHLHIIDTLAAHNSLIADYQTAFRAYQKKQNTLKKLINSQRQLQKDLDYLSFQLNELQAASLQDANEQEQLEQELLQLNNADTIKQALLESTHNLEEHDFAILTTLNTIQGSLGSIAEFSVTVAQLNERIDSVIIELQDINGELAQIEGEVVVDEERANEVDERLNLIYRLQKKHQVDNIADLMAIEADLAKRVAMVENSDEAIAQLQKELKQENKALMATAQQISTNRKQQIPLFEQQINDLLTQVGMPNATIKTQQTRLKELALYGIDEVEVLFAANRGSGHDELRKVASGGELSRLMLCIQSLMADNMALPTLIFDEIDTGISGEVAQKVGKVMEDLAEKHQVICITHLPQMASKGNHHFFVYKDDTEERTISRIKQLNKQERITEIAKMLSGDQPGKMALANAKELLKG